MRKLASLVFALLVTATLGLGFVAPVGMAMGAGHEAMVMMNHDSGSCASYCLSKTLTDFVFPQTNQLVMTFLPLILLSLLTTLSILTILSVAPHISPPGPAPNLLKLYAHYLD